ncbi:MAG: DUF3488 domain-containing protein [Phycisphaeraceae bacterium]|nr:DUF3488 domain-containing protein [Phycisphaeraceae bacterium]
MKWIRRYNALAIATVATAVLSFCMADGALALAGFSMIVMIVAFVMRHRKPLPALPKIAVNVLVLAAILNAGFRGLSAQPGSAVISHLGEFLVLVQLIKLFDRRAHRDETQLLTLSVFIAIAAILTSNSFVVGVLLLVYSPLIIGCSMLAQMRQEEADGPIGAPRSAAGGATDAGLRRGDRQFAMVAGVLTVSITVMAVVLFVLTPRGIGDGGLGSWGQVRQTTIGFTDTVKVGQSGLLNESTTPVLDLLVTDQHGRNMGAPGRMFYLRGAVQSTYNQKGRVWEADKTTGESMLITSPGVVHSLSNDERSNTSIVQKITIRNLNRAGGHLFTIWRPTDISFESGPLIEQRRGSHVLRYREAGQPRFSYTVVSDPAHRSEDDTPADFSTPSVPPDIAVIARSVLESRRIDPDEPTEDPADRARLLASTFRDYLRDGFDYTLDLPAPPGGKDPIVWFLRESRRGHCEYFASALATMLQSMGVPARLVTGYVAGEFNTLTNEYLVRESNAHAWVEVYVGDGRWATYDATPVGVVERLHQPTWSLASQLRQWYDLLEFNWSASVVGFDRFKQEGIFGGMIDTSGIAKDAFRRLNELGEWLTSALRLDRERLRVPPIVLSIASLTLICALAAFLLWSMARRRLALGRVRREPVPPELRFIVEAERLLAKAGEVRPDHRTPLTHAGVVARLDDEASARYADLVRLFYKARFGHATLTAVERREAQETVDRLRERVSAVRHR